MYLHYLKLKNRLASFVSSRIAKLALDTKITPKELKMTLDNKCLVLVANPMDEAIGLAGLMLTYPKNFEILLMTTGYTDEGTIGGIASHVAISDEIKFAMETLRPLGYKIFDIPAGAVHKAQRIFEKINISEIDYLFLPNIFSRNPDDIALLDNVANLLEETEYKSLKDITTGNYYNISEIQKDIIKMKTEIIPDGLIYENNGFLANNCNYYNITHYRIVKLFLHSFSILFYIS